jgi:GGDEF domain-containing protein
MSSDEIAMPDSDAAPASGPPPATTPPRPSSLERARRALRGRAGVWAAVAAICVVAGTVGSLLAATTVAHNDATATRQTFQRTSAGIASALRVAVQREEDLAVSASTFYAGSPRASSAEFARWADWAQMLRHYPELDGLSLVTLVRAPELAAFAAHVTGKPAPTTRTAPVSAGTGLAAGALPGASAGAAADALRIVPASTSSYHCLAVAELTRSPRGAPPAGLDYCARTPALLSSRDSARSIPAPTSVGQTTALAVETPVYRGGLPPLTTMGRRAAFVGWLREVLVPGVLAQEVLRDYPGSALRLRYRTSPTATAAVTSGAKPSNAQSATIALHGGWSARIFGPAAASGGITADGEALGLLIGGILLSVLLGLLSLLLGARRTRAPALTSEEGPREAAAEELYDPVTGLPNRVLTLDLAGRMVARAQRQSGTLAGALIVDIDWFEDVNDKLGQLAGEQLMTVVAKRLDGVVRAGDTIGRLDGDELVVLVESAARGARLDSLAQRVM